MLVGLELGGVDLQPVARVIEVRNCAVVPALGLRKREVVEGVRTRALAAGAPERGTCPAVALLPGAGSWPGALPGAGEQLLWVTAR